jgi:hypothetical protein
MQFNARERKAMSSTSRMLQVPYRAIADNPGYMLDLQNRLITEGYRIGWIERDLAKDSLLVELIECEPQGSIAMYDIFDQYRTMTVARTSGTLTYFNGGNGGNGGLYGGTGGGGAGSSSYTESVRETAEKITAQAKAEGPRPWNKRALDTEQKPVDVKRGASTWCNRILDLD